jgi:hypothetical protein
MPTDAPLPIGKLVLDRDKDDSTLSLRRRRLLTSAGLRAPSVTLEVGPFDNPTLRSRDGFTVRYADYFSADELRTKWANNPRRTASRIVDVDYVIKGPRLSPFIPDTIDLMVANHVIEHICDPIGWLCDVARFCSPDAAIFLAVPDQRFTFDFHKQPSDITSIVRAYEEAKTHPDAYDVARMHYLHARVDAQSLWDGEPPPERVNRRALNYRQILEKARLDVADGYVDVHCHFYTASTFVHIFSDLFQCGYIPWEVELLRDVERGDNEFCVLLRRRQTPGLSSMDVVPTRMDMDAG